MKPNYLAGSPSIGQSIVRTIDDLHDPLPTDAKFGTVYFHAAGLTLPPVPLELGGAVYVYERADDGAVAGIRLVSKQNVRSASQPIINGALPVKEMFEFVPKLQSCARGVLIGYNSQSEPKPTDSKTLSNGKTIYFTTEPLCLNDKLLQYAKQVDAY